MNVRCLVGLSMQLCSMLPHSRGVRLGVAFHMQFLLDAEPVPV